VLRAFTIADYNLLRELSRQIIYLNNQFLLTRGSGASTRGAYLSAVSAFTGIHTFTCNPANNHQSVIAQVYFDGDSPLAHCLFLAPSTALESRAMPEILDGITKQIGLRGAHSLIAEVEEVHPAFKALRQSGFSIYARQRVWKLTSAPEPAEEKIGWRPVLERDQFGIHLLRKSLVPGQVQQIEIEHSQLSDGYVLRQDGEIVAYAEVQRGSHGIWVQPFVHLDAEPFERALAELIVRLRPRNSRPVYVCLRSYQDWLQSALEDLGAQAGPRQVVMARRTSVLLPVEESRRVPLPNRGVEPTTPMRAPQPQARYDTEWIHYDQTPNYR
jgi:hypothetical protein